jgi:hypothetical protein
MQAFALGAHDDDGFDRPIDGVICDLAAFIETIDKVAEVFERPQRLIDVAGADDGKVFEGAGGGFSHGFGEAGGTAFGDDDPTGSGGVGGTDDGAEIVRIFDAVEHDQEVGGGGDRLQFRILLFGAERNESLVGFRAGETIKGAAVFEADGDMGLAGEVDDLLDAATAEAAGDQDALERPACTESFDNRVKTNENGQKSIIT